MYPPSQPGQLPLRGGPSTEQQKGPQPVFQYNFYSRNYLFRNAVDEDQVVLAPWRDLKTSLSRYSTSNAPNFQVYRRMCKELATFAAEHPRTANNNITYAPIDSSLLKLLGCIARPPGTRFEGDAFYVHFELPPDYPASPPVASIPSKPFDHPNIDPTDGRVKLDILSTHWVPALTLDKVLLSISSVLDTPAVCDDDDDDDDEDAQAVDDGGLDISHSE